MDEQRPLVRNASDAQQVRQAKKEERRRSREALADLKVVLSLPEGRRFIGRMFDRCKVFSTTFSRDQLILAFNEGARSVGTDLLREITPADPAAALEILKTWVPKIDVEDVKEPAQTEDEHGE